MTNIKNNRELLDKFADYAGNVVHYRGFVEYEKLNQTGEAVRTDIMNLWEWLELQRRDDRQYFRFKRFIDLEGGKKTPEKLERKEKETEIIEDELECPLCGFAGKNEKSLQMHKMRKHYGKKK